MEVLLKEGAHIDCQDEDLWTPLHIAAAASHEEIVHLLLKVNNYVWFIEKKFQESIYVNYTSYCGNC